MSGGQGMMLAAALLWVLLHVGLAGSPLRWVVARTIGENGFRGVFSLLSALSLAFLIWAYNVARRPEHFYGLWVASDFARWLALLIMPFAFLLLICAITRNNPAMAGADMVLKGPVEARGIFRITRHPMLWAFSLWAIAHLISNGDLASLYLFGSILIVSLAGMASIDRKRARQQPRTWPDYQAKTSLLPFAAISAGRNRLEIAEIGYRNIAIAIVAWLLTLAVHPLVFGVSALP